MDSKVLIHGLLYCTFGDSEAKIRTGPDVLKPNCGFYLRRKCVCDKKLKLSGICEFKTRRNLEHTGT